MEIINNILSDCISVIYKESKKDKNKKRLEYLMSVIKKTIFKEIEPYLYAIIAILVIMISMNMFQFYYYMKLLHK